MKNTIKTDGFVMDNGEHYENRIPMRLWAEDDLPSEKLLMSRQLTNILAIFIIQVNSINRQLFSFWK